MELHHEHGDNPTRAPQYDDEASRSSPSPPTQVERQWWQWCTPSSSPSAVPRRRPVGRHEGLRRVEVRVGLPRQHCRREPLDGLQPRLRRGAVGGHRDQRHGVVGGGSARARAGAARRGFNRLLKAYQAATPATKAAFCKLIGQEKLFDELIAPATEAVTYEAFLEMPNEVNVEVLEAAE